MLRRVLIPLVVAGSLLALLAAWLLLRAPTVPALTVHHAPLVRTLLFSGRVASASRVDVGATATGRVEQVLAAEGAEVKQNQPLLLLETAELRAALAQAQANERQAAARLNGLKGTGRRVAQAGVAQADSVVQAAQATLRRSEALVAQGFFSEARLDEDRRALAVAQAQRDTAVAQSQANEDGGTDLNQAQAQLAQAKAAVAAAQVRLDQATVRAPSDARVLLRKVEPGQIVQPGAALFTLALNSPLELVGQVDERYLDQLQIGQTATVRADAFPQQGFAAQLRFIASVVDAERGAVEVKLAPPQAAPAFLREDMTLSIEVVTGRRERALVLPLSALSGASAAEPGRQGMVQLLSDGRVEKRPVSLGMRTMDAVEVLEGLKEGDVMLLGAPLDVGQRVRADTSTPPKAPLNRGSGEAGDAGVAMTQAVGR